eukprot:scaffold609_cov234-Pinguiococcus_pyrenoidosus.AAC.8
MRPLAPTPKGSAPMPKGSAPMRKGSAPMLNGSAPPKKPSKGLLLPVRPTWPPMGPNPAKKGSLAKRLPNGSCRPCRSVNMASNTSKGS